MTEPNTVHAQTGTPDAEETVATPGTNEATSEVVRVLDQYMADLEAGKVPNRAGLLAEHPTIAMQLEQCLPGIEFIHQAAATPTPRRLGDFELVGEVGRGGMGVVYEARQISLNRRVALKVLRFGVVADKEAMERFQREAEMVAHLHHTNIVPIFALGNQHGVSYYAMQFIEGRSLAAVMQESQQSGKPLGAIEVARWGLQAAQAMVHAHQRGVIHRDIKPSNLLLDPDGRIWLTDFGLAKRIDDVSLSMAGAMVGTPRYMIPEQANARKYPVDQRTDIYSLGATLYELATGKPLFEGTTAHEVITQILSTEPRLPRLVRSDLPKDLETILVKCLSKEPQGRYATAQAMEDDLRAFAEGRPIKARRVSFPERTVRWVKKQKRSVVLATTAAAAAALLITIGLVAMSMYRQSRLGSLSLGTKGSSLLAEVLKADRDEPALVPFTVPQAVPVSLPAGDYRLRVSGTGLLSETYDADIERGSTFSGNVELHKQLLWEPINIASHETASVVKLNGAACLIRSGGYSLILLDGATAAPVWTLSAPEEWPRPPQWGNTLAYGQGQDAPEVLQPAPDLDGDGQEDIVWAVRSSASLWAISGKGTAERKGRELWWFTAGPGQTFGVPAAADVDGDGTPDLVAMFANPQGAIWIESVNGKTGRSLWRSPLEATWFQGAPDSHWSPNIVQLDGRKVVVCVAGTRLVGLDLKTGAAAWPALDMGLEPVMPPRIADLDGDGQPDVLVLGIAGSQSLDLIAFSGMTRMPLWKKTLRSKQTLDNITSDANLWDNRKLYKKLVNWPWITDLAGGHKPQVILPLIPTGNRFSPSRWGGVEVLDGATGQARWKRELRVAQQALGIDQLIVGPDVNGDGSLELFAATAARDSRGQSLFVDALSGKDGRSLWWWQSEHSNVYSGSGGRGGGASGGFSSVSFDRTWPYMAPLRWWCEGPDGWPQLVVSDDSWGKPQGFVLSAGTGRLIHKHTGEYELLEVADLNHDGLADLVYRAPMAAKLSAIRGQPPVAWQRLGNFRAGQDFDGDGIVDLLGETRGGNNGGGMCAISGRDGRILWRSPANALGQTAVCPSAPLADLDGDGTPDVLLVGQMGSHKYHEAKSGVIELPLDLQAVSGKSGKQLWNAEPQIFATTLNGESVGWSPRTPVCVDLTGEGRPTVLVPYEILSGSGGGHQAWMAAMSGRDGKVLWRQPLSEKMPIEVNELSQGCTFPLCVSDLDGDGTRDLVVAVPLPPDKTRPGYKEGFWSYELRALSGRDGKLLWRRPLPVQLANYFVEHAISAPIIDDLAGDGNKQLVVLFHTHRLHGQASNFVCQVQSYNPKTGELLWNWEKVITNYSSFQQDPHLFTANLDGGRSRSVCANNNYDQTVVLDSRGQARAEFEGIIASQDLDGDGREEALVLKEGKLRAMHGAKNVLWERDVQIVREILPGKPAATIVVNGQGLLGLDGATGRPLWQVPSDGSETILVDANNRERPRLITMATDDSRATVCRLGLPISPHGTPVGDGTLPEDPRVIRHLPWVELLARLTAVADVDQPRGNFDVPITIMIVLSTVFVIQAAFLCYRRRWRRLKLLAVGLVLVTLAMGIVGMYNDSRGMNAIEYYSWSGWYWVAVFGIPVTGLLVLAWRLLVLLILLVRRAAGRVFLRPAIA